MLIHKRTSNHWSAIPQLTQLIMSDSTFKHAVQRNVCLFYGFLMPRVYLLTNLLQLHERAREQNDVQTMAARTDLT